MTVLNAANEHCILDVTQVDVIVIDGENHANLKTDCAINDIVSFFTFETKTTKDIVILNKIAQFEIPFLK